MRERRAYVRALALLADCAMHLTGSEAGRLRNKIKDTFREAEKIIPGFRWNRSVNHFAAWVDKRPVTEEDE